VLEHPRGDIEYDEQGAGPTLVLVPGSWSTGAAWKGVIAALARPYRVVTTSLLGYGGTDERRTDGDRSLDREAEIVEAVIERAGAPVHLVGHSFGGLACLAVALRGRVELSTVAVLEATVFDALRAARERDRYDEVLEMTRDYTSSFAAGDRGAARHVIDFYGGEGSYDAMSPRMRESIVNGTPTNILDWSSALGARQDLSDYGAIGVPSLVVHGALAHRCVALAAEIVADAITNAQLATIPDASHFMLTTHPAAVAALIEAHVDGRG
jgi:pimeloyl-ACP methyl ester carboxylesterase